MSHIRLATAICARSLGALSLALDQASDATFKDMITPEALEDERGRFRVWAGNLGALQRGHSSLDYRLRDAPLLQENVLQFLAELRKTLEESISVVTGQRLPYERQARPPDDSDDDISDDSSHSDCSDEAPPTELSQRFSDIVDIINNLYSLSIRIRTPTIKTRALKAAAFRPTDKNTGVGLLQQYLLFDLRHVKEVMTGLRGAEFNAAFGPNEFLIERLAKAINKRRQLFLYWRKHRQKLASVATDDELDFVHKQMNPNPQHETSSQRDVPFSITKAENQGALHAARSDVTPKTILSATTATVHDRSLDEMVETQSVTSVATTARDLSGHSVELPPPPLTDDNDFECPYCLTIVPSRYANPRAWRNHLLQDLSPYVCTYENCDEPEQLYRSRREWEGHEASHRKAWKCPQHSDKLFRTPSAFRGHMEESHSSEHLTQHQIDSIIQVSTTATQDFRACPICLVDRSLISNLHTHLANHLERLAVFALPRGFDSEDARSVEGESHDASRGQSEVSSTPSGTANNESSDGISKEEPSAHRESGGVVSTELNSSELATAQLSSILLEQIPDSRAGKLDMLLSKSEDTSLDLPVYAGDHQGKNGIARLEFDYTVPENVSLLTLSHSFTRTEGFVELQMKETAPRFRGHAIYENFQLAESAAAGLGSSFPGMLLTLTENEKRLANLQKSSEISSTDDYPELLGSEETYKMQRYMGGVLQTDVIPNIIHLYRRGKLKDRDSPFRPNEDFNKKISLVYHDITRLEVDAIVNGTNSRLSHEDPSSLSYYIHSKAGPDLGRESSRLGHFHLGDAVITDAYNLPCQKVIHAIRPMPYGDYENIMSGCYQRCLELAIQHNLKTIAFPALATGGYGMPNDEAAILALRTLRRFMDQGHGASLERIIFCVYNPQDELAYQSYLPIYFPPASTSPGPARAGSPSGDQTTGTHTESAHVAQKVDALLRGSFHQEIEDLRALSLMCSSIERDIELNLAVPLDTYSSLDVRELRETFNGLGSGLETLTVKVLSAKVQVEAADMELLRKALQRLIDTIDEIFSRDSGGLDYGLAWNRVDMGVLKITGHAIPDWLSHCRDFLELLLKGDSAQSRVPGSWDELAFRALRSRLSTLVQRPLQGGSASFEIYRPPVTALDTVPTRDPVLARDPLIDRVTSQRFSGLGYDSPFTNVVESPPRSPQNLAYRFWLDVPTLEEEYAEGSLVPFPQSSTTSVPGFSEKISLIRHDITKLEVEAIVNATNTELAVGGDLDKAILSAAGGEIGRDLAQFGGCETGEAVVTPGYNLRCKRIIHTVPPNQEHNRSLRDQQLIMCYTNCLELAQKEGIRSLALPAMGTGRNAYPKKDMANLAISTVQKYLVSNPDAFDRIIFCVYQKRDLEAYRDTLPAYFEPKGETPRQEPHEKHADSVKDHTERPGSAGPSQETKSSTLAAT